MGTFVVISGPSTVGKTTVVEELLKRMPEATRITTLTTRKPREGEKHGEDFFFVSREEFEKLRDEEKLIEWSEHFSNYYGTSHDYLTKLLKKHPVVFGVIDINGAQQAREREPCTKTIFLKPGDPEDLKRRMAERANVNSEEERAERLARALTEIEAADQYDHVITNVEGKLESTIDTVRRLITGM